LFPAAKVTDQSAVAAGIVWSRNTFAAKIEDSELRRKPIAELDWRPSVDASQIGVAVGGGPSPRCPADALAAFEELLAPG
jgi:hypothetical protein